MRSPSNNAHIVSKCYIVYRSPIDTKGTSNSWKVIADMHAETFFIKWAISSYNALVGYLENLPLKLDNCPFKKN